MLHQDIIAANNPDLSVNTRISGASIPAGASVSQAIPTALASLATTTLSWTPVGGSFFFRIHIRK